MFRPFILIGAFVIGIALFSFLLIPGFRTSTTGILVMVFALVIGGYAIIKDLVDLWRELKETPKDDIGTGKGDDGPPVV
jgi:hypothetical protein